MSSDDNDYLAKIKEYTDFCRKLGETASSILEQRNALEKKCDLRDEQIKDLFEKMDCISPDNKELSKSRLEEYISIENPEERKDWLDKVIAQTGLPEVLSNLAKAVLNLTEYRLYLDKPALADKIQYLSEILDKQKDFIRFSVGHLIFHMADSKTQTEYSNIQDINQKKEWLKNFGNDMSSRIFKSNYIPMNLIRDVKGQKKADEYWALKDVTAREAWFNNFRKEMCAEISGLRQKLQDSENKSLEEAVEEENSENPLRCLKNILEAIYKKYKGEPVLPVEMPDSDKVHYFIEELLSDENEEE